MIRRNASCRSPGRRPERNSRPAVPRFRSRDFRRTVESAHELTWQPAEFTLNVEEQKIWKDLFQIRDLALAECFHFHS